VWPRGLLLLPLPLGLSYVLCSRSFWVRLGFSFVNGRGQGDGDWDGDGDGDGDGRIPKQVRSCVREETEDNTNSLEHALCV
jgi:hypothetical protein